MPTPNMGLDLPVENADDGVWDTKVNDSFDLIDAHDHTTGNGAPVPFSGLSPNADLSFANGANRYAIINTKAVDFEPQATTAVTGYSGAIFVNSADNELYWRSTSGTNVKLTSGASINAAALGAIGGDYGTAGAEVAFVDASDAYTFKQQVGAAVRQYARGHFGDIDLFEFKAHPTGVVPTTRVRLASPASLASSYTVTFPAAVPGATSFVYMSSAGTLTASQVATATNITASGTLAVTGATTLAAAATTTITASGLITASAGLTAAANQHVTVSGSGLLKHGDRVKNINPATAFTKTNFTQGSSGEQTSNAAAAVLLIPVAMDVGQRIRSVTVKAVGNTTVDGTIGFYAYGIDTTLANGNTAFVNVPVAASTYSHTGIDYTMAADSMFIIEVTANASGLEVYFVSVTYDQP